MEYKTLGELCDVVSGGTPSRSKQDYWNGDIPWIKIGNIKSRYISEADEFITEAGLSESSAKMLKKGTILYTIFATLGEVGVLTIDACTNQAIAGITIKDESIIDRDYLFYFLKSKKNYVNEVGRGVAQNNINMSILRGFEVPLRNLHEQQEITEVLDKTSLIIEALRRELEKLDKLIKARFVEMFGEGLNDDGKYPLLSISEIGKVVSGATPKTSNDDYWDGENLWITPAELTEDSFVVFDTERKITDEGVNSCAVHLLPVGTVILSSRAPIGKVAIAGAPMYCNQGFKNIIPNEKINSVYLFELLSLETEYLNSLGRGATFKEISKQIVESIRIKVPPKKIQNQFADFVKQVDKSKFTELNYAA